MAAAGIAHTMLSKDPEVAMVKKYGDMKATLRRNPLYESFSAPGQPIMKHHPEIRGAFEQLMGCMVKKDLTEKSLNLATQSSFIVGRGLPDMTTDDAKFKEDLEVVEAAFQKETPNEQYDALPEWAKCGKAPQGKFSFEVLLMKVVTHPGDEDVGVPDRHGMVLFIFFQAAKGARWSKKMLKEAVDHSTAHFFLLKRHDADPNVSSKAEDSMSWMMQIVGGWHWSHRALRNASQAEEICQSFYENELAIQRYIIEKTAGLDELQQDAWINSVCKKSNKDSPAPCAEWDQTKIRRIIELHKKVMAGSKLLTKLPHTILSIKDEAIDLVVLIIALASRYGAVCIGRTGRGKTSVLTVALMALSRLHSASDNGGLYVISDMDQLRGKRATAQTPVFLDDGCLRAFLSTILKHFFGVPNYGGTECMLQVRYDHATLTSDCARAAADNPIEEEEAKKTQPEAMTWEKLKVIIRPSFHKDIAEEDYKACLRRIFLAAFLPVANNDDETVVHLSRPDQTQPTGRKMHFFRFQGHIFKPETANAEEEMKKTNQLPEDYEKQVKDERKIVQAILGGELTPAFLEEFPLWADSINRLLRNDNVPTELQPCFLQGGQQTTRTEQGQSAEREALAQELKAMQIMKHELQQEIQGLKDEVKLRVELARGKTQKKRKASTNDNDMDIEKAKRG